MQPRTLSASALNTASLCLARYKAENIDYTPRAGDNMPADLGTACHAALERFVDYIYIKKIDKERQGTWELLLNFYIEAYKEVFRTALAKGDVFNDGKDMLKKWFQRTDLSDVQVLSVETKHRFPLATSIGEIPVSYIFDRLDYFERDGRKILRVVDYKTIRANLSSDQLRKKIQARIYDLMVRIQYKDWNVDEVHVVFDLLRHNPVGVIFEREDTVDTFRWLQAEAERIIAAPSDNPPETLNAECNYCVRKLQCRTLQRNIAGGGFFGLTDVNEAIRRKAEVSAQKKALEAVEAELDQFLLTYGEKNDLLEWSTLDGEFDVNLSASTRRGLASTKEAARILGPEVMARIGKINISEVDKLIKGDELTVEQKVGLQKLITRNVGNLTVKVNKAGPFKS